jgi:hypothetical protein
VSSDDTFVVSSTALRVGSGLSTSVLSAASGTSSTTPRHAGPASAARPNGDLAQRLGTDIDALLERVEHGFKGLAVERSKRAPYGAA